ncbi:hypothetical protein PANT_26d00024 [Moesziomyces antarcticus T-34]|uniref:Phospholipid/glycerol acyltransferase domain-containing protein n=1 Tax=Pseudozyma antarctica (strain T-34) TaxID=1151754 RepID=M9MGV2_PSEA3|nr:hypothetical protein PANT_26d00024 [Moesziomyces antarcticus T-34]
MADASVSGAPKSARASATASASGSGRQDAVPRFGAWWTIMRSIGDMSLPVFFSSIHVSNASFVPPPTTPLIVCANHSNTIIDVAVLASHFPHRRPLHFWAKAGFFKNPITRSILTSSGNIKVDRRNKNNQALFQGTFRAMKAGGAIALFPEGGSYTIPYVADLKMGAAWAALEYARYLQLAEGGGMQKTQVEILPTAVVFDDKSKFRSRGLLRFGKPIRLDAYIDEFLSAPSPSDEPARGSAPRVKEDGTVPATPESMTRTNTSTGQASVESYASPAHRAVARLTADLQRAIEALTFNAPDWETFQATRAARELVFELEPDTLTELRAGMDEHVEVSRELMGLLTQQGEASTAARRALFVYACMLHLCDVDNLTLARVLRRSPTGWGSGLWSTVRAMALRLPLYIPVFGPTLVPMYLAPRAVAHHFARREEESLSSVKTLVGFVFTSTLYAALVVKTMQWTRWTPPGLLVGIAAVWWLHDLNRSNIDTAYGLVKQLRLGWRLWRAKPSSASTQRTRKSGRSMFFYGTLVHPRILARVIGSAGAHVRVQNAVLDGATLYHVRGEEYPGLVRTPTGMVKGTLVTGLTDADVQCLDAFEGDEYVRMRVGVLPDPSARVECNETRIANAGTAPLHAVLSSLTSERMEQVRARGEVVEDVEVYAWSAGREKLEERVWEFDVFAREHAARWIGEGAQAEHEHEYQVVDAVQANITATQTMTSTPPGETPPAAGKAWIESAASSLSSDVGIQEAIRCVCGQLSDKPSIQFYVDRAFAPRKRPSLSNPALLAALLAARQQARDALQSLVDSIAPDTGALDTLIAAHARALHSHHLQVQPHWPFTPAQYAATRTEPKKSI